MGVAVFRSDYARVGMSLGLSRGGKGGAYPPVPLVIGGHRPGAGAGLEPWMPGQRPWMAGFTVGSPASNAEAGVGGELRSCGWRGVRCGHGEVVAGSGSMALI